MARPTGTLNFNSLDEQIVAHLNRHGPMDIARLTALVRHNAQAKAVHTALKRLASHRPTSDQPTSDQPDPDPTATLENFTGWIDPVAVLFDHAWHNGRRRCIRKCVRLTGQKAKDYRAVPRGTTPPDPVRKVSEAVPAGTNTATFDFMQ